MTHVYTKARLSGALAQHEIGQILADTGATFTVLPEDVLQKIGAAKLPTKTRLELGDGRNVEADVYAVVMTIEDREGATLVVTFPGAKSVLGVRSLEDLGLKVDPVEGTLEPTRPAGVAYYYRLEV